MDGPCNPQPSRHPDLYPRWSSRDEGFSAILPQSFARIYVCTSPCLPDPVTHCSLGYKRSEGLATPSGPWLSKGVAHRHSHIAMAADRFGDFGGQHGSAHRLLDQGGIQVVSAVLAAFGTVLARAWGSCNLPQPGARSR